MTKVPRLFLCSSSVHWVENDDDALRELELVSKEEWDGAGDGKDAIEVESGVDGSAGDSDGLNAVQFDIRGGGSDSRS